MRSFAIEGSNPPIPALCATLGDDHVDDHDHDCFDDDSDGDDGGDDGHDGKAKDDDTEDYDDNYKVHNSSNVGDNAKDQI